MGVRLWPEWWPRTGAKLAGRPFHEPAEEVLDPGPAVDVMLHHGSYQHVYQVRFVGTPVVPITAIVAEVLHPNPLPELLPPEGTEENRTVGAYEGLAIKRFCFGRFRVGEQGPKRTGRLGKTTTRVESRGMALSQSKWDASLNRLIRRRSVLVRSRPSSCHRLTAMVNSNTAVL